ncbi:unnamed protein product [Vitrella brassicaformis CCMP3155]|uniref:FAD/NAD(P)-binding domain-containing protein n=2 Tax=Vitrella brassicaformis TaxID=1169539 RepID=A0A0G4EFT1_VITBC|nr:unnamed protein product [Vitrella brassicaformis CCMP3155]|eukprot:CEL94337.1 unnamed protein product [Vitrella brassicaformis CCMP3155]
MGGFCSQPQRSAKHVVIVGGGLGGKSMAGLADTAFAVTLVEKRGAMIYKIGMPRGLVDTSFATDCLVPYDKLMPNGGTVRTGVAVTRVDGSASKVHLDNGSDLSYDYLILAVGARSHSPCEPPPNACDETSTAGIIEYFKKVCEEIKTASRVVLVGGGPVGVELAGEIRQAFGAEKSITVCHSGPAPCHNQQGIDTPAAFQKKLLDACKAQNIDLKLNVKADLSTPAVQEQLAQKGYATGDLPITLSDGEVIQADMVISCIGATPGGQTLEGVTLDGKGAIKVNEHLQVEGFDAGNVFAIGDCTNTQELRLSGTAAGKYKMGMMGATGNADVVFDNIKAIEKGKKPSAKIVQPPKTAMMIVPVGTHDKKMGAVVAPVPNMRHGTLMGFKQKDYFLKIQRDIMNAPLSAKK